METYEYEVVPTGLLTDRDIDQAAWLELGVGLDAWGKAGWELLSVGYNDRGLPSDEGGSAGRSPPLPLT